MFFLYCISSILRVDDIYNKPPNDVDDSMIKIFGNTKLFLIEACFCKAFNSLVLRVYEITKITLKYTQTMWQQCAKNK